MIQPDSLPLVDLSVAACKSLLLLLHSEDASAFRHFFDDCIAIIQGTCLSLVGLKLVDVHSFF